MQIRRYVSVVVSVAVLFCGASSAAAQSAAQVATPASTDSARVTALKAEVKGEVEKMRDFTQQMIDQLFSFGELGFQEIETHKYLVGILRQNGFTVEEGGAGIPTAFMASWGSGKPVITLGSDIDGIPQSSQKPGVAYRRRSLKEPPATARATTPARRSTSPPPSR
jgi:aminobenzoyl-glutamate utilization protein B